MGRMNDRGDVVKSGATADRNNGLMLLIHDVSSGDGGVMGEFV